MKGQVYKAKRKTIYLIISTPLMFLFFYMGYKWLLNVIDNITVYTDTLNIYFLTSIIMGLIGCLFYYKIVYTLIWNKIIKRYKHIKENKHINHYNLCIKHIDNMDFNSALKVYNKVFKNNDSYLGKIINLSLKVVFRKSLKDEYIKFYKNE